MKNLIITVFFSTILLVAFNYDKTDKSLARVKTVSGKLVFYENEPVEKYEVVFSFENLMPNYERITTQKVMDFSVQNAFKESGLQGGKQFDGIITRPKTKRDLAVKFLDKSKDNSIARVFRVNGKFVFIECEPINEFNIVSNIKVKFQSTRQQTIDEILKKAFKEERKGKEFDGILFGSTTYDNSIKFK
jgi:hypothetical protein